MGGTHQARLPVSNPALLKQLHAQALDCGFSIAPGALFSSQGQHNHCLRLNSSHPWSEQLEQALHQLAGLINRQLATEG